MAPKYEVADILREYWPQLQQKGNLNSWQLRILDAIKRCRTASLGGHIDGCTNCGQILVSYNSCRNRHCPKCQGQKREQWIQAREEELLPVPYFHVVFTIPDTLNQLCLFKPKLIYDTLFKTAWSVINSFGHDPKWLGAQTGMFAILHTWGQTLSLHPHLHCVIPGGGLTRDGRWVTAKSFGKYLFSVKAMSKVFRARFVDELKAQIPDLLTTELRQELFSKDWVVYAKRPFGSAHSVIEYLGRYTHKIAISNHRLEGISNGEVCFTYKDYKDKGQKKVMALDAIEFIRRFAMHILPRGLVRIRHYGILSNTSKQNAIPLIRSLLAEKNIKKLQGAKPEYFNPRKCPCCGKEALEKLITFKHRGPPIGFLKERAAEILKMVV